MTDIIFFTPFIIFLYCICIYKKIKDGYEQHFKYMNKKQRVALLVNILVFIIGACLMTFGIYKNLSTTNYFKKNGVYAEGEIIAYRRDGSGFVGGYGGRTSTYTYKIQIENNDERQHYYAWVSDDLNEYRVSEKVNFYYLEENYTETYVGVINAMIEGKNYCESGILLVAFSYVFLGFAPLIWLIRHNVE